MLIKIAVKMERSAVILVLWGCIWHTLAYPQFQDRIPNGNKIPHPCKSNYLWHGVGHHNPLGGGVRNQFGLDFYNAGKIWTKDLCLKDSDGDGWTNGQELGDPGCIWIHGGTPARTNITHPGICTNPDGTICAKDSSWVDCNVEVGLKDCDVLKEPETRNITIRFPETTVPAKETTYMCMIFDLPQDQDYHLVAHEPYIDNHDVMHHILLYGCDPEKDPIEASELNQVKECNMGASYRCQTLIGLWAVGFPGYCLNAPAGFRFGGQGVFKQAALEFHWNNPMKTPNYTDSSGFTLYYTPKLRPNDAGILMTGQNFLEIPPGVKSHTTVGKCHSNCTRNIMSGPINIFWAINHMHYLGHGMDINVFRDNSFYTELTNDHIYSYDSPVEYSYDTTVEILPGDEIVTTCRFKSLSNTKTTFWGLATSDEMCYGFLAYYPASNLKVKQCVAWKDISQCDQSSGLHNGCNWHGFLDASRPEMKSLINAVHDNCNVLGSCLKECKATLENLRAENPCLSGDIFDLIRNHGARNNFYNQLDLWDMMIRFDSCKVEMQDPCPVSPTIITETNKSSGLFVWWPMLTAAAFGTWLAIYN